VDTQTYGILNKKGFLRTHNHYTNTQTENMV